MNQQHYATSLARVLAASIVSVVFTSCWWDDSPTAPVRAPRNTFADYQHIGGLVNGVWTKEHNPYVITGEVYVEDNDSLVIHHGVEIVASASIQLNGNSVLKFLGSPIDPIRYVHNSPSEGGGVFVYSGAFYAEYTIFEGHGKNITVGVNTKIMHSIFSEIRLGIFDARVVRNDSTVIHDCIFSGYRPWDDQLGGAQLTTKSGTYLDSSKADVHSNLFYTGIGDSTWEMNPPPVVDVLLKGQSGTKRIQDMTWPGNGNIFANPLWVKYNYVGPSPAGISDNDYRLQSGSPAIGAASDGTNIGVY